MSSKDARNKLEKETIISAARSGDSSAMDQLLSMTQPDVRRYAMKHCKISDIDDAVQEVLLTISRRLDSLKILAAFSSWVFKSTQRECRRLGRATINYDPFEEGLLEEWIDHRPNTELLLELANALGKLSSEFREALLLKDLQQLTLQELADETGISLPAAKSRVRRARLAARSLLLGQS
ncbi:MAG: sigma-70 family RNA polymerase sigma factor [Oleispira sp.]|nr:sigma-70 family RNA polymerase sigma factor [Oleispira sp.]MBL4881784.1 sigma-70 family RNA polymerase sigma factor [Oleispira sp.]